LDPKVDIIIVNYRSGKHLQSCIEGLLAQTEPDFRVYLVDNSPATGDVADLTGLDERFEILHQPRNVGFAVGCNAGAWKGRAAFVAMLNPDATPAPDWLEQLLACMHATGAEMAGSTQLLAANSSRLDGAGDAYMPLGVAWRGGYEKPVAILPATGSCFSPCAAASIYRRSVFEAVGGFDERFFCYMEDVDIAYRIRLRGGTGIQCSEAVVSHVGSASSGRASPFVIYHGTRNRIWTYLKNTPPILLWLTLPGHLLVNLAFLLRSVWHGRFRETWEATRDGFAGWGWISKERRELAKTRKTGSLGMMKVFTWSPVKLLNRLPDVRKLPPDHSPE
jgi:GT2 family glycosyltransferase